MKKVVKDRAPVQLTGGAGFRYESAVGARFLLDLLGGTNALGVDFGQVSRVDWQARDSEWLADDLAVTCKHPNGDRAAGVSIKSYQQVTRSGFPQDFVKIGWAQWLGFKTDRKLRESSDAIVLVTGSLARDVQDAWSNLHHEALQTAPERMAARLSEPAANEGAQSSALQRALFQSFHCPDELQSLGKTDENTTIQLLCRIRLLYLDYDTSPSRDHARALADCQSILRSADAVEAEQLWRRLVGIADEKRAAGASIRLPQLLDEIRGQFDLRDHPDYRHDWEVLERSSQDFMADFRTQIAGLPPLPRVADRATIQNRLDEHRACLLVGESGCGKSALAKEIGQAHYPRIIWMAESTLDYDGAAQFERGMGISHSLVEILATLPNRCLVVFDGVERYSPRALRLASRFIRDLLANTDPQHIHILVTAQFEAADRLIRRFAEFGVPPPLRTATALGRPSKDDVQNLVGSIPELQWASLRPELRPLLTNLKVLDWVVAAAQSGTAINDSSFIGLTNLIDALWERWIEGDADRLGRSRVLKHLGILEADSLSAGVPLMQLEHGEQAALEALAASDLIRIRDERVRFSHDLLGDWARMRILIGEQSLSSPSNRDRATLPRWHRAVRLFGERLLEQFADGSERWQRAIEGLDHASQTDATIRDLLLESLFLSDNAATLLERSWGTLSANDGRLLNRMLNRFLFVATLPDPRFAALIQGEADGAQWEHLFRIPYWPYWGPMLTFLQMHRAGIVRLAPHATAKLCSLWLRTMPIEISPGQPMPWRQEAAELSVAIGREIQALNAAGDYFSDGHDKVVYEAVLWAARELQEEVGALCLELAQRRDLRRDIRLRVDQAHQQKEDERRQWLAAHPDRQRAPPIGASFHGPLGDPWPDGPRDGVENCFQEACLDSGAFSALVQANTDVALEVLLAVCIEGPQYEDYSSNPRRGCGLDHWHGGDPPLYCRGPFLPFLHQAPEQGLSFVLKLVNFATRCFADDGEGLVITVDGDSRMWLGDPNVFRWHHDWPLSNGSAIHCSLMALERWLYEHIDRGENIDHWISRILRESESLAFAGLLFDVGKRLPALFSGVLKPLLRCWQLVDWDRQVTTLRQQENGPMGYWRTEPAMIIELGREWFAMPHRRNLLVFLNGGIIDTMMGDEQQWPFLEELRAAWARNLDAHGQPESLRLLIERFNPSNYTFELRDGKRVPVDFQWPDAIARQNAEGLQRLSERSMVTNLPWRCRGRLDASKPLPPEQVIQIWQFLQSLESNPPDLAGRDEEPILHIEDVLCGGIAILVVLHHDWLTDDANRMAWCRRQLEVVVRQPPALFPFDSEMAGGEHRWDAFAADAGIVLLAKNRDDTLARQLVVTGVLSFHYSTTAGTMFRAFQCREQLGEDLDRLLGLAVRWAGLRVPYSFAMRSKFDELREDWQKRKASLIHDFVDQRLPIELPDIREINSVAVAEIDAVQAQMFPRLASTRGAAPRSRRRGRSRETLYPDTLRLDSHVISSAFVWLDLQFTRPDERRKHIGFIRNFLDILLGSIPGVTDPRQQEIKGLPDHYGDWVFSLVAKAIPRLTTSKDRKSFWQPILDLGPPAHEWVERFFWYWFTDGLRAASSPEDFARLWTTMIQHALESAAWDPSNNRAYDLDGMVYQLLGFDSRMNKLGQDPAFGPSMAAMEGVFASAAQRWFRMSKVVIGFLNFVVQPAATGFLVPGIRWLAAALPSFGDYDWRHGLEDYLIAFLYTCWERESERISSDPPLQKEFLSLLAVVVSRGSHAAISLRDRVVNSIAA